MLWVVDAHPEYQNGLQVPSLAREGYSGLIVKATQSITVYSAPARFDAWITQARDSGMVPGAYHWLTNADGMAQADAYVRRIERHLSDELLITVDNEDVNSPASLTTLKLFSARVQQLTGRKLAFHYSGAWWAKSRIGNYPLSSIASEVWDARYVTGSGYGSVLYQRVLGSFWTPGYGSVTRSKMLQFTSHGTAGGIVGNVDIDAFDGTIEELHALAKGKTVMALDNDERAWLQNIWRGLFTGGDSCGEPVPAGEQLPASTAGNALFDLLQHIRRRLDEVSTHQILTDEQYTALMERLLAEVRPALQSAVRQGLGDAGDLLGTLNNPPETS